MYADLTHGSDIESLLMAAGVSPTPTGNGGSNQCPAPTTPYTIGDFAMCSPQTVSWMVPLVPLVPLLPHGGGTVPLGCATPGSISGPWAAALTPLGSDACARPLPSFPAPVAAFCTPDSMLSLQSQQQCSGSPQPQPQPQLQSLRLPCMKALFTTTLTTPLVGSLSPHTGDSPPTAGLSSAPTTTQVVSAHASPASVLLSPAVSSSDSCRTRNNGLNYVIGRLYEGRVRRYDPGHGFGFLTASHELIPVDSPAAAATTMTSSTAASATTVTMIDGRAYHRTPVSIDDIFVHANQLPVAADVIAPAQPAAPARAGARRRETAPAAASVPLPAPPTGAQRPEPFFTAFNASTLVRFTCGPSSRGCGREAARVTLLPPQGRLLAQDAPAEDAHGGAQRTPPAAASALSVRPPLVPTATMAALCDVGRQPAGQTAAPRSTASDSVRSPTALSASVVARTDANWIVTGTDDREAPAPAPPAPPAHACSLTSLLTAKGLMSSGLSDEETTAFIWTSSDSLQPRSPVEEDNEASYND